MLALVDLITMANLADVEDVAEQIGEGAVGIGRATDLPTIPHGPQLGADTPGFEIFRQLADRAKLDMAGEGPVKGMAGDETG